MEDSSNNNEISVSNAKPILIGKTLEELTALVTEAGHPAFRAKQLYEWLYRHVAITFDDMTTLSKPFRQWLIDNFRLGYPEIANVIGSREHGSQKILFRLHDNRTVESVLMEERQHQSLCVSSQVGCAVDCKFCMTGFGGFQRQMTTSEIVAQFLLAKRLINDNVSPRNMVFMGMGEPMLNLDNVIPAIRLLTDPNGIGVSPRRITVSTSGIVPAIDKLGAADTGVNIAISLNASNDEFRNQIMPINKKYPIDQLLESCRNFPMKTGRRITFEYVMLAGLNDSSRNAKELAALLRGMPCKVNLIPWNPDPQLPFNRPEEKAIRTFQALLQEKNYTVTVRYSKGLDIGAACGQLAGHWKKEQDRMKAAAAVGS